MNKAHYTIVEASKIISSVFSMSEWAAMQRIFRQVGSNQLPFIYALGKRRITRPALIKWMGLSEEEFIKITEGVNK